MSAEKLIMCVFIVAILCFTGLIAQCTQRVKECQVEAIKSGKYDAEKIRLACSP